MTTVVRIIAECPPIMTASGESVDAGIGDIVEVVDHLASTLVRRRLAEVVEE